MRDVQRGDDFIVRTAHEGTFFHAHGVANLVEFEAVEASGLPFDRFVYEIGDTEFEVRRTR